jgi:MoxR-like ATPases
VAGKSLGVKTVLRPNGTEYHIRKFGDHDDVAALRDAREHGLPIMAYGPPGTGKTALIEAAYAVDGKKVYTVQGTGDTETADFVGSFTQLPGGAFEWNDGPMLRAMEEGAVLYIDEIALIDPKVMAVAYSVMDGRGEYAVTQNPERGIVTAAEGFYIASACNPNAPGARLSEAIVSRFLLQFEVTTDYALAKKLGVPAKLVTAAQNLQRKYDSGEVGWAPQLRECIAFRDVAKVLGEEVALRNVIAGAPEIDRPVVQDVLQRTYGKPIEALAIT